MFTSAKLSWSNHIRCTGEASLSGGDKCGTESSHLNIKCSSSTESKPTQVLKEGSAKWEVTQNLTK